MAASLDPSAILSQLAESYIKLPLLQKLLFPLLIGASVMGIIFVSNWANRPDYVVLYSDLSPGDSAAVVQRLKTQKIKYEVRGDGTTIAISPPDMVHELRMSLASEGVPKGGSIGFEIFDSASLGSTTFVEKLKFLRALQGELERTIGSLDAVQSVRVHITQPEKTVFVKRESEATASVMLKLRPGGELDQRQIKGIANLVAGSVEGLKYENVTIVDIYGNMLTKHEHEEEALGIEATRLQYQREVEHGFVKRVEQMLEKVVGPGKVIARVTADLDFSTNEREEESYDPGGLVMRSERSIEEGAGSLARGGVPGVVSNLSNDPALLAPTESGKDASSRREQIKNYEVSKAITKSSAPRGKLTRLSVAVLVDGTYDEIKAAADPKAAAGAVPAVQKVFKPLEPEMLRQIEAVAKSAVGLDIERGDTLTVENIPFHVAETNWAEEMDKKATQDLIFNSISKGLPILFVVLFFLVVIRPLVKFLVTPTEAELDLSRLLPTGIEDLEKELEQEKKTRAEVPSYEPAIDMEQLEEVIAENSRVVKENPQQAALLIRYWLNDGRL